MWENSELRTWDRSQLYWVEAVLIGNHSSIFKRSIFECIFAQGARCTSAKPFSIWRDKYSVESYRWTLWHIRSIDHVHRTYKPIKAENYHTALAFSIAGLVSERPGWTYSLQSSSPVLVNGAGCWVIWYVHCTCLHRLCRFWRDTCCLWRFPLSGFSKNSPHNLQKSRNLPKIHPIITRKVRICQEFTP